MNMLFNLANAFMNSGLLAYTARYRGHDNDWEAKGVVASQYYWVDDLCAAMDNILTPILILVATAGLIYSVVLGVNLARADSSDKQQEAKKRLVYAIVGLVVIIVLIILLKLFIANIDTFLGITINPAPTS